MVRQLDDSPKTAIVYPDSDGKPMADNTRQFRWITTIKSNLDWLFANNADVFVAGDLLWYPVEGDNKTRQAPDVMVALADRKGKGVPINSGKKKISPRRWFLKFSLRAIPQRK